MEAASDVTVAAGEGHGRPSPALLVFASLSALIASPLFAQETPPTPSAQPVKRPPVDLAGGNMTPKMNLPGMTQAAETPPTPEELAAARGVESMLVNLMIEEMRKSVPESELVPVSQGERVFRQMLDQEYAQHISDSDTLGIADLVVAQLRGKR